MVFLLFPFTFLLSNDHILPHTLLLYSADARRCAILFVCALRRRLCGVWLYVIGELCVIVLLTPPPETGA